jgi:tRNA G37 N-methylase TrmD
LIISILNLSHHNKCKYWRRKKLKQRKKKTRKKLKRIRKMTMTKRTRTF